MAWWKDNFWRKGIIYVGSFGSAEMAMSMWGYQPSTVRGLIIFLAAFAVDMTISFVVVSSQHNN